MKKLIKITSIFIVLLIMAIIVTPFFFKDKITEIVKKEINNNVNAEVDFGDVSLTLFKNFPDFTFSINNLKIIGIDEFKNKTLFATKEISLTIDLGSVFSGEYELNKILLNKPVINLLVLKNGKANWDIAKEDTNVETEGDKESEEPLSDEAVDAESFKLMLKAFIIEDATINYDDKEANMYSFIDDLDFKLSGDMTANNTNLDIETEIDKITYKMDNIAYLNKAKIVFKANILTDLEASKYTFIENSLSINGLVLNFDGFVGMPNDDISMNLTYNAPNATFKSLMSLIPAFYTEGFEDVKAEGKVVIDGMAKGVYSDNLMPSFAVNILVNDAKFQYPDLPKSVNDIQIVTKINSPTANLDNMTVDVSKFHFSIAKNPMDIKLKLKTLISDPDIDANFKGKMNLMTIKDVYPLDEGMNLSGIFKTDIRLKGKQSAIDKGRYRDFKASGNMQLKNVVYRDNDFPKGIIVNNASMVFTPRYVDMSNFKVTYNKNIIEADGKLYNYLAYALDDGILKGDFSMSADYLNLNNMMASSEVESKPKDEDVKTVSSEEAPIEAVNIPENINLKLQCVIGRIKYDNLNIKALFGKVIVANKKMMLDNLKMEMLGGKMNMSGYYSSENIDSPKVAMIFGIKHFDFKKSYKTLDVARKLAPIMQYTEGNYSCILKFNGKMDNKMNVDLNTVNSKGLLSTSALTIKDAKSITELANTLKIEELKTLKTDPLDIPFQINDGKLIVSPFSTKINDIPIKASGVTYLNQNIDYNVEMSIPREKLGSDANDAINGLISQANTFGANIKMSDNINVIAKITGTTTKPNVGLNFDKAKQDAKNQLNNEIEKQKEALKKKAEEEVDKLKKELEEKAKAEMKKQQDEWERKSKEEKEKLKKKLEEEAKKKLSDWF
ncbi:MAG: hypothetical protein DRI86_10165 [Bacteroidetes bacterium]|nr:MAG: hypothetical protein DRI86_10165 [Bacteroidota bacterium]